MNIEDVSGLVSIVGKLILSIVEYLFSSGVDTAFALQNRRLCIHSTIATNHTNKPC